MVKENVGPRIDPKAKEFYDRMFQTVNGGATYILEAYPILYEKTLQEIKGKFNREDLMVMVDVFNGHAMTNKMAGEELWWSVAEGIKYDALDTKWGVDKDTLLYKIQLLTIFQKAVLEIWANSFWYGGDPNKKQDLEAYVGQLL